MVMPSAPPRIAKTAAAAGSGSWACRACRTVATWSMLTPRRTMVSRLCPRIAGHHVAVAVQLSTQDFESEKRQQYVHDLDEKTRRFLDSVSRVPIELIADTLRDSFFYLPSILQAGDGFLQLSNPQVQRLESGGSRGFCRLFGRNHRFGTHGDSFINHSWMN